MPKVKQPIKTTKGESSKKQIIDVALAILQQKEFEEITVREICRASGTSIGNFYHHFSSKQDIYFEYIEIEKSDIKEYYETILGNDPYDRLISTLNFQMKYFAIKGKKFLSLLLRMGLLRNENFTDIRSYILYDIISECIEEGQRKNFFDSETPAKEVANLLTDLLIGLTYTFITSKEGASPSEIILTPFIKVLNLFTKKDK